MTLYLNLKKHVLLYLAKNIKHYLLAFIVLIDLEYHLSQLTATDPQNPIGSTFKQILYEAYRYHMHDQVGSNERHAIMASSLIYCKSSLKS